MAARSRGPFDQTIQSIDNCATDQIHERRKAMNRIKQAVKTRWLNAITIVALSLILPVATLAAPPNSAGNTQIWNQVTVNYNNAAGVFQTAAKSNLVTVSVNTV